jgi:DNA-binding NarL/FixJ family response regulator
VTASGPRRAVVVDDSSAMRMGIKGILKKLGLEIVGEGANGHEAIELARVHRPDIVMLDVNMPLMTGIDAIEGILAAHPSALVIMMTSVADEESVEKCLEKGAANYVLKSSSPAAITASIQETLDAR